MVMLRLLRAMVPVHFTDINSVITQTTLFLYNFADVFHVPHAAKIRIASANNNFLLCQSFLK